LESVKTLFLLKRKQHSFARENNCTTAVKIISEYFFVLLPLIAIMVCVFEVVILKKRGNNPVSLWGMFWQIFKNLISENSL
jgi:hypothetical protein